MNVHSLSNNRGIIEIWEGSPGLATNFQGRRALGGDCLSNRGTEAAPTLKARLREAARQGLHRPTIWWSW